MSGLLMMTSARKLPMLGGTNRKQDGCHIYEGKRSMVMLLMLEVTQCLFDNSRINAHILYYNIVLHRDTKNGGPVQWIHENYACPNCVRSPDDRCCNNINDPSVNFCTPDATNGYELSVNGNEISVKIGSI